MFLIEENFDRDIAGYFVTLLNRIKEMNNEHQNV